MRYFWGPDGVLTTDADEDPASSLDAGTVRVRVLAASINTRDVMIRRGRYPVPVQSGVTPLSDGVGRVVEIGPNVTRVAVGDRVCATYFPEWRSGLMPPGGALRQFGCTLDGMLASERVFDQEHLVQPPAHLTDEEAAALPCAMVTGWNSIHAMPRQIEPDQSVGVVGSGDVALAALGFARAAGAKTIAVTSSPDHHDVLRSAGAAFVVVSDRNEDWSGAVRSLTGGSGVDLFVETVGARTFERSLKASAPNAQLALIGAMGGQNVSIDAGILGAAYATIRRIFVGSRDDFEAMNSSLAGSVARPIISAVYDFKDAARAFDDVETKPRPGKSVIRFA